jgi:uncharacterized protein YerC
MTRAYLVADAKTINNVRALRKTGHTYQEISDKTGLTFNQVVAIMRNHINQTDSYNQRKYK